MSRVVWFMPLLALGTGCVSVAGKGTIVPPTGIYSHFRAPLTITGASFPCENLKKGESSSGVYVKEWVYTGIDAGVCEMALEDAIRNGQLTKVHFADYEQHSLLGFVTWFSVTAYGE